MATRTRPTLTPARAGRLYKLLSAIGARPQTRAALLKALKVTLRGFYRDLELLRGLGVDVRAEGDRYRLAGAVDDALDRLPFPDPGLSFRDAIRLAAGRDDARRKLRTRVDAVLRSAGAAPRR